MKMKAIPAIKTKAEAQAQAQNWRVWASTKNLSYSKIAEWRGYFTTLGKKFGLLKEFKENGII